MENLTYDKLINKYWSVIPDCQGYNRKDLFDRDLLIEKIISRLIEDNEVYVASDRVIILDPIESWLKEIKKDLLEGYTVFENLDVNTVFTLSIELNEDEIYIICGNENSSNWYTMTKKDFITRPLNNILKDGLMQIINNLFFYV